MPFSTVISMLRFAAETTALGALSMSTRVDALIDRISGGRINREGLRDEVSRKSINFLENIVIRSNILGESGAKVVPMAAQAVRDFGSEMTRALLRRPDFANVMATRIGSAIPNVLAIASAWGVRRLLTLGVVKNWAASGECRALVNMTAQTICTGLSVSNALPVNPTQRMRLVPDLPTNLPIPSIRDIGLDAAMNAMTSVRISVLTVPRPHVPTNPLAVPGSVFADDRAH